MKRKKEKKGHVVGLALRTPIRLMCMCPFPAISGLDAVELSINTHCHCEVVPQKKLKAISDVGEVCFGSMPWKS